MPCRCIFLLLLAALLPRCAPYGPDFRPHNSGVSLVSVSRQPQPSKPDLKRLPNGHYRVLKPWTVNLNGRKWLVQRGYTSNGITAPKRIKNSIGDGVGHPETWAAVFHDWLFTQPGISRATADSLFFDLLVAYGVPVEKARLMHATVSAYSLAKTIR